MTLRTNYLELAPQAIKILMDQEAYLAEQFAQSPTVNTTVWELVKLRVSQMNQCAFCVDMHSRDLLRMDETPERIIGLSAWRDMPHYSDVERMALDFAEQLTLAKPIGASYYQHVVEALGEQAVVDLTVATNAINSWNRVAKTFKPEVGSDQP